MQRDFAAYLCDVYQGGEAILSYTSGFDLITFAVTPLVQDAVERRFEIIGEAITQCRRHHLADSLQLGDVQGIIDFRNHLAHRYHNVSHVIVWDIVQNDLPALMARVKELLAGTPCI